MSLKPEDYLLQQGTVVRFHFLSIFFIVYFWFVTHVHFNTLLIRMDPEGL